MLDVESEIRIAFGGGGEEDDERLVLDRFGAWLRGGRLLFIPLAMDPPYDRALAWVTTVMAGRGVEDIAIATSPDDVLRIIPTVDGVFIGGGNTYRLLHSLRSTGAHVALSGAARRGLPLYGGSAGAILLGSDIDTARWDDTNAEGLIDTMGLDLALGYSIACHYDPAQENRLSDYVANTHANVAAIPEASGLLRIGDEIRVAGPASVALFRPETAVSVKTGASLPRLGE